MREPTLEHIRWIDSSSAGGAWMDPRTLREELPATTIETIGWVVYDEDDRLIVAGSRSEDGEQVGEVLVIVKVAVLDRQPISLELKP